jgi:hypothetical protein
MPMGLGLRGLYRGHIDLDTQVGNIYIYIYVLFPPLYPTPPTPFAMLLAFPQGLFFFRENDIPGNFRYAF